MDKRKFAVAVSIILITIFTRPVEASPGNTRISKNTTDRPCNPPKDTRKPVIMAKRIFPDRPDAIELDYGHGFSTAHNINESVTIRMRCTANYNITTELHGLTAKSNDNLTAARSTLFKLVEKHITYSDWHNWKGSSPAMTKAVEVTLSGKVGHYLVKCFASECNQEAFTSALGIDYFPTTLQVFTVNVHDQEKIERELRWGKVTLLASVLAAVFVSLLLCALSLLYIQNREEMRRAQRHQAEIDRRASEIPLSELRPSIAPETSTSCTSDLFAGCSSSFVASTGEMEETHFGAQETRIGNIYVRK